MSSDIFQRVSGVDATGALKGDTTIDLGELGVDTSASEDVTEHVYIVFAEGTSIEDGVALIEKEILGGSALEVRREDTTGNAVVAIVTSSQRQQIEELSIVTRVKVNEAEDTKKNSEDAVTSAESSASEAATSEAATSAEASSEEVSKGDTSSVESETESVSEEALESASGEAEESGYAATTGTSVDVSGNKSSETGSITGAVMGAVGAVLIICCIIGVILGRKKKR